MLTKLKIMIKIIEEKFGINKFNLNKNNNNEIFFIGYNFHRFGYKNFS